MRGTFLIWRLPVCQMLTSCFTQWERESLKHSLTSIFRAYVEVWISERFPGALLVSQWWWWWWWVVEQRVLGLREGRTGFTGRTVVGMWRRKSFYLWARSEWLPHTPPPVINLGCAHQSPTLFSLWHYQAWCRSAAEDIFWWILVIAARRLWFIAFAPSYWLPGGMNTTNCLSCCPSLPSFFQPSCF